MEKLSDEMSLRLDKVLAADAKVTAAYSEFVKNIPARILQCSLDVTKSNKQGIVQGDKVYKYGYVIEKDTVFLEFYENRNQGQPTMAIYVDAPKSMLTIRGTKAEKSFLMCFKAVGGKVESTTKFDD